MNLTAGAIAVVLGALGVGGYLLASWWRRRKDAATIARLQTDVAVTTGERDVAQAQVAVVAAVEERKSEAIVVADDYRAQVAAEVAHPPPHVEPAPDSRPPGVPTAPHVEGGPNPLDKIHAADRVRAKIAGRK